MSEVIILKVEIRIQKDVPEPYAVLYAGALTPELQRAAASWWWKSRSGSSSSARRRSI